MWQDEVKFSLIIYLTIIELGKAAIYISQVKQNAAGRLKTHLIHKKIQYASE